MESSNTYNDPLPRDEASLDALLQEPLLSPEGRRESSDEEQEDRIVDGLPWNTSFLIKSLFFLDALGSSTWGRFSAIYYNLHGLSPNHIGLIEGARSVIPTLSMVYWGVIADRFHSQKMVWLITKAVSTVVLLTLALPWVYTSFLRIMGVSILAQLFVASGILDAYTLDLLGTENKIFYGRYRLYASLSWGIGSIIMGWVTDHYGFEPNFIMFALLGFLMILLVGTKIPDASSSASVEGNNAAELGPNSGKIMELVLLALRPRVFVFLLEVVIMGAGMATVERLLFLYMVNDLKASTLLCGLSVGVNVLFELPIFWYASKFMAVLGHDGMFILAMTCFVFRLYGYTLLTPSTKWLILPLEVMHGITFACFWIVSTDISKVLVHQTQGAFWKTAIPSSVQMLYGAFGVSLGSIIGGWAMNRYGSRVMYIYTANIVGVTLVLHILGAIGSRLFCNGSSFLPDYPHSSTEERQDDEEQENLIVPEDEQVDDSEIVEGSPAQEATDDV
jgi:MFS family permease